MHKYKAILRTITHHTSGEMSQFCGPSRKYWLKAYHSTQLGHFLANRFLPKSLDSHGFDACQVQHSVPKYLPMSMHHSAGTGL
jgi:hypothetical protein